LSTVDLAPTLLSIAGIDIPYHLQGRAFLGPQEAPARDYVFMTRDRYDESYDMVRAVRDKRFKYIRNYRPELPYALWIPSRNKHPIMQEIWRLHLEDRLQGPEKLLMQSNRPVEELYDIQNDPHEIENLAGLSDYHAVLERFRTTLDQWRKEVADLGNIPESEMVRQWYPQGNRPTTAAPLILPITSDSPGTEPAPEGGTYQAPLMIQLYCATQGASIAYTFDAGDTPHWQLYTSPIRLSKGKHTLRAKAVRIGYLESDESVVPLNVD